MAAIYGELKVAQLECLSSDPATTVDGRVYFHTSDNICKYYNGAAWKTFADTNSAQVFTLKDYDGGTASDTNRTTLAKNTTTNLNALARKEGNIFYNTTLGAVVFDNGSTLSALSTTATATPTVQGIVTSFFAVAASAVLTSASATINISTTDGYQTVLASHTSDQTINLPAASSNAGRVLKIVKTGSGGTITLDANSTELINGSQTQKIYFQYGYCEIACDGTGWYFVTGPIEYGTYSPTLTDGGNANGGSLTPYTTNFYRVGNQVSVAGTMDIDALNANTLTRVYISLPIASNMTSNQTDMAGTGTAYIGDANDAISAIIIADPTGDRAEFVFPATDVTSNGWSFNFQYIIK